MLRWLTTWCARKQRTEDARLRAALVMALSDAYATSRANRVIVLSGALDEARQETDGWQAHARELLAVPGLASPMPPPADLVAALAALAAARTQLARAAIRLRLQRVDGAEATRLRRLLTTALRRRANEGAMPCAPTPPICPPPATPPPLVTSTPLSPTACRPCAPCWTS